MKRQIKNPKRLALTGRLQPNQDLVVTKWVGLEGSVCLVQKEEEKLLRQLPYEYVENIRQYAEYLSVEKEKKLAAKYGAKALCEVSEGGIFGALWEMADDAEVGIEVDLKKIPIRQETIEICEVFAINPYQISSRGVLLIGAENGSYLVKMLEKEGVEAAVIGYVTAGNDRVVYNRQERRFLEPMR